MSLMNTEPQTQPYITSRLDDFVEALNSLEQSHYNQLIRSMDVPSSVFKAYTSWCDKSYTRNCIAENEKYELILLCWKAGQITPIHDHGGEECWVRVIQGEFKETIYTAGEAGKLHEVTTIRSKADDVTYMIDFMGFHRIENLSSDRSMTLHLYAKPIRTCNVLDEDAGVFVSKEMAYSTVYEAR